MKTLFQTFSVTKEPQTSTTPHKCIGTYQTLNICISRQYMVESDLVLEKKKHIRKKKKKTLEKHFFSQDMLVSCEKKKKKRFWYEFCLPSELCFAPLSDLASHCSFDQQPKSVRATLLQLYYHKMYILCIVCMSWCFVALLWKNIKM